MSDESTWRATLVAQLIRISDPHTTLRPGALGTVRHHDPHTGVVDIDFDAAGSVSMR